MNKLIAALVIMVMSLYALKIGDPQPQLAIEDQFGHEHNLSKKACWIISWDRDTTEAANLYFANHAKSLTQCYLIVDTSQIPSGIMMFFVRPAFEAYGHPILLSEDAEFNKRLPFSDGNYTQLLFESDRLKKIRFVRDINQTL